MLSNSARHRTGSTTSMASLAMLVSAVLLAAAWLPGCRCSSQKQAPNKSAPSAGSSGDKEAGVAGTPAGEDPAKKAVDPAKKGLGPTDRAPVPDDEQAPSQWPKGRVDVLVLARLPLADPAKVDALLRPIAGELKADTRVLHVWRHADAGEGRLLVRFGAGISGIKGRARVEKSVATARLREHGTVEVAAIAFGARAVAALSLDAPGGRVEASKKPLSIALKMLREVPGVTRLAACGAISDYLKLGLDPSAMGNLGVRFDDGLKALKSAVAADGEIEAAMKRQEVARRFAGGDAAKAFVSDIAVVEGGVGAPSGCEAMIGRKVTTAVFIHTGAAKDSTVSAIGARVQQIVNMSESSKTRPFYHHLHAAERFLVELPVGNESEVGAIADRLGEIARSRDVLDIISIQGIDGIPRRLSIAAQQRRMWTVWVALEMPGKAEAALTAIARTLGQGGWKVHALPLNHDVAMGWLLKGWASAGAAVAAQDPGQLSGPITKFAAMAEKNPAVVNLRSGPRRRPPPPHRAVLNRKLAVDNKVAPSSIAQLESLLMYPPLVAITPERRVYVGIGSGILRRHLPKMPLAPDTTWGTLAQLPDTAPVLARISRDGRPVLWFGHDAMSLRSDDLARDFWRSAAGHVAVVRGRVVLSFRMTDRPLASRLK